MQLSVGNKEYIIEFTFEAAESEAVQTAFDYFSGAYMFKGMSDEGTDEEKRVKQLDAMIGGISAMPKLAIDFLFMGLLENHGPCGEITQDVLTRSDAKAIYKQFCKENPESDLVMQSNLFEALKEQMEADGFFKRIGLEKMMQIMSNPNPVSEKKTTKKSAKA